MSLAIVGKVGASIAFLGTSSIVGCVLIKPKLFGIYSDVDVYAISTEVSEGATGELTDTNFKCKFAGSDVADAFDCEVFKLKTKTEKHYEINDTNNDLFAKTKPTVTELKTEHTVFKIKFSDKHWDQTKHIDQNIEIIPKMAQGSKKYADLKSLFVKHNGKVIGKTNYFVAKAEKAVSWTTSPSTFKCWFKDQESNKINCTITEFSDSETTPKADINYKSLIFKKSVNAATTITQHKHYLIQFTGDNNKHEIEDLKHNEIHLSVVDATTTKFQNVTPSFYDDNYDGLFIV